MLPSRTHAPCGTSFWRLNQKTCARTRELIATQVGSSALRHGEVARLLIFARCAGFSKCAPWHPHTLRTFDGDRDGRGSHSTRRQLSTESLNRFQLKAWKSPEQSRSRPARSATPKIAGVPMLPPTSVGNPAAVMISPVSEVVVVLPFEPVMATMGPGRNCAASSISPITVSPRARACTSERVHGNAWADHDQILAAKSAVAVASGLDGNAVIEQHRNLVAQFVAALSVGDRHPRAMRLQKTAPDATPDLPRPTTSTRLLLRSIQTISPQRHSGPEKIKFSCHGSTRVHTD